MSTLTDRMQKEFEQAGEAVALCLAADRFNEQMKAKLIAKVAERPLGGWRTDTFIEPLLADEGCACIDLLLEHVARLKAGDVNQVVDIANFCMFLYEYDQQEKARQEQAENARQEQAEGGAA